jgi:hypothetical protein
MNSYFHQDGIRANDLPFNRSACDKYGGCPFQTQCKKGNIMTNSNKNGNILGETSGNSLENSLIQKLSSTPPPIMVDISPPDAPPPSYSLGNATPDLAPSLLNREEARDIVLSLEKIKKEMSALILHFKKLGGVS